MSVKTYSLKKDGEMKLSGHFRVSEFACKDGTDMILIDDGLPLILEQIREALSCSKINVNSGYRTEAHNKKVGGSSVSQHIKGKAADIICFDKNGNRISSKKILCTLDDFNHQGGAARINDTAVHIDVRGEKKWYDETTSPYTYTSDFYAYFGILRTVSYPIPTDTLKRGSKGDAVKWLQSKLSKLGYNLTTDGSFGPATDAAVRDFQKSKGLAIDGRVGPMTRKALGV